MFTPGFNYAEAESMLKLCMQLNGTGLKDDSGNDIPPPNVSGDWGLIYNSVEKEPTKKERWTRGGAIKEIDGIGPFDNAWGIWKENRTSRYAIVIRGTVSEPSSILDDVLATTILANSFLKLQLPNGQKKILPIQTVSEANVENAAVHLGFAWGAATLLYHKTKGILNVLIGLPVESEIYIAGHSQGAAIATLLHSLLQHAGTSSTSSLGSALADKKFSYKSYVFAQPKPGNWQYGHDFAQIAGNFGNALCINNNRDWVPQVPLSFDPPDEVTNNPIDDYLSKNHPVLKLFVGGFESMAQKGRKAISDIVEEAAKNAEHYLGKNIDGKYLLETNDRDNASPDLNYVQCGRLLSMRADKSEKEGSDLFWQHHCGNYEIQMKSQLSVNGKIK
jgi:hypothetical protein